MHRFGPLTDDINPGPNLHPHLPIMIGATIWTTLISDISPGPNLYPHSPIMIGATIWTTLISDTSPGPNLHPHSPITIHAPIWTTRPSSRILHTWCPHRQCPTIVHATSAPSIHSLSWHGPIPQPSFSSCNDQGHALSSFV